ncbi:MAG: hypothetical protein HO274_00445 [Ferrovum myxofaciens]|uniref:MBL fold metallo-hydrolase n=1 Tax=Ferrovum myxofaciens TaxID=416213 RepID=UPI002354A9AC|nr:hypothetical protein [Ferrovum myxofaciens]QKE39969.1 MAG: hypothetical protein HO274_00445 [Ferrovum myxofaciens]
MWNSLGSSPSANEIEITVLGPGYGESVVVHLGNGEWLIVDSCVDSSDPAKSVAPLRYLREIGVQVEKAVKYIIVSHWDDDHVKGISDVLEKCLEADFICSQVFSEEKFACFVEASSINELKTDGGNVRNIRRVLQLLGERNKPIKKSVPARQLSTNPKITCWSPSDLDSDEFFKNLAQNHPKAREELRKAILITENLTSVVLTIEWPYVSVLLGADMENSLNPQRGWSAIVSEAQKIGVMPAGLVKIPHHGSQTGHHDGMWISLLTEAPVSVITPFGKGRFGSQPPTRSDITRIRGKSKSVFVTARHGQSKLPKMELAVQRSLRDGSISLTTKKIPMGIVRHRRTPGSEWVCELFGAAYRSK